VDQSNLVEKTSFLRGFVEWLTECEEQKAGLSKETFQCAKVTSKSLALLCKFLISKRDFEFVLLGKIQSDKIEGRFGKFRQMVGGNLYTSVRQFVEADRTIKMLNLSKMNFAICNLKEMFGESKDTGKKAATQTVGVLLNENYLDLSPVPPLADQNSLFYISGCFARNLSLKTTCSFCKNLLLGSELTNEKITELFSQVNRGGLTIPSEIVFQMGIYAWNFYSILIKTQCLKQCLISENVPSVLVFEQSFILFFENSENPNVSFLSIKCVVGHSILNFLKPLLRKFFNAFSKNFVVSLNSFINESKINRSKRNPTSMKVKKLKSCWLFCQKILCFCLYYPKYIFIILKNQFLFLPHKERILLEVAWSNLCVHVPYGYSGPWHGQFDTCINSLFGEPIQLQIKAYLAYISIHLAKLGLQNIKFPRKISIFLKQIIFCNAFNILWISSTNINLFKQMIFSERLENIEVSKKKHKKKQISRRAVIFIVFSWYFPRIFYRVIEYFSNLWL